MLRDRTAHTEIHYEDLEAAKNAMNELIFHLASVRESMSAERIDKVSHVVVGASWPLQLGEKDLGVGDFPRPFEDVLDWSAQLFWSPFNSDRQLVPLVEIALNRNSRDDLTYCLGERLVRLREPDFSLYLDLQAGRMPVLSDRLDPDVIERRTFVCRL
ncbi:hypothetical protein GC173_15690 [bacterium]|nr:hypothetical protein [bacterium]